MGDGMGTWWKFGRRVYLWCPGCEEAHGIPVEGEEPVWAFDGNKEAPTLNPSIKVEGVQWASDSTFHKRRHNVAEGERTVCHSFMHAGVWEFCGDSTHDLAGQHVPLAPTPTPEATKENE